MADLTVLVIKVLYFNIRSTCRSPPPPQPPVLTYPGISMKTLLQSLSDQGHDIT